MTEDETFALADAFYRKAMLNAPYRQPAWWRRRRGTPEWNEESIQGLIVQVIIDTDLTVSGGIPLSAWLEDA